MVWPGFSQLVMLSILKLPQPAQLWELMPEASCPVIHGWPQPVWRGLFFIFQWFLLLSFIYFFSFSYIYLFWPFKIDFCLDFCPCFYLYFYFYHKFAPWSRAQSFVLSLRPTWPPRLWSLVTPVWPPENWFIFQSRDQLPQALMGFLVSFWKIYGKQGHGELLPLIVGAKCWTPSKNLQ